MGSLGPDGGPKPCLCKRGQPCLLPCVPLKPPCRLDDFCKECGLLRVPEAEVQGQRARFHLLEETQRRKKKAETKNTLCFLFSHGRSALLTPDVWTWLP